MSRVFRFLLFLSSYFPAFLIIFILYLERDERVAWISLGLGALGLLALLVVLMVARTRMNAVPVTVKACRRNDAETMTYVISYLVPFVGGILEGRESMVAYVVLFLVIGLLYANSNMVHINPMLNLFGFRLHEAKLEDGDTFVLVSRRRVIKGQTVRVVGLGDEIYLESKTRRPKP